MTEQLGFFHGIPSETALAQEYLFGRQEVVLSIRVFEISCWTEKQDKSCTDRHQKSISGEGGKGRSLEEKCRERGQDRVTERTKASPPGNVRDSE